MRNYISILMVALVALCATSCQLEGGTTPNPNKANNLLWSRTQEVFNLQYEHILTVAQLNDTLRDAEYGKTPYDGYNPDIVESEEGVYTLQYGYERTYRINTGGKKLEEGAEWIVHLKYGNYMDYFKLGVVKGVVGEPTKFNFDFDDTYGHYTPYHNVLKSDLEYWFNTGEGMLDVSFSNSEGYTLDQGDIATTPSYIIMFKVTKPMEYNSGVLYSGEVDILYKDNILNTQRGLTVEIFNKFVTFAPLKGSDL